MKTYQRISRALTAYLNCVESGNTEWRDAHQEEILSIVRNTAPSGSGIDRGTSFSIEASKPERLVFEFEFHHMNEMGYYDGWATYRLVVTPSLAYGKNIKITGSNRNQIKDYLYEVYDCWLEMEM